MKRVDCPYMPGNRGVWQKTKCLNEEEFVIFGYSEQEGCRIGDTAVQFAAISSRPMALIMGNGVQRNSSEANKLPS